MSRYTCTSGIIVLLVLLYGALPITCFNDQTLTWRVLDPNTKLTGMLLSRNGDHIIVAGTNAVYNLNASNLEILNHVITGPNNASTDTVVTLMIYNQSYSEPEYVTTCANTENFCSVRNIDDVTRVESKLQKFVRSITGVQAFVVDSVHGSTHDSYLFVGCPHMKNQRQLEGLCNAPGIFWFKDSGHEVNDNSYPKGFKDFKFSNVKTEKFVAAFSVEKMRLFFSIQNHTDGSKISRVAQVCQYYDSYFNKYTTPHTYVDMPIKCGHFEEIMDVKKVIVGKTTILVGVFTGNGQSAVCVYTMAQVNQTFVDNIKVCYNTSVEPDDNYYFKYFPPNVPCSHATNLPDNKNNEYYLCNTDNQQQYHHMIGIYELSQQPVIQLNETITSFTTTIEGSTIISYLATTDGRIVKASVYPIAGMIRQPYTPDYGQITDMLTSYGRNFIYVLTDNKVYKTPVESCSSFTSCSECLTSDDPHCGWCMLENRCTIQTACNRTYNWMSAVSTDRCPSVLDIQPESVSERDLHTVSMNVSHTISSDMISCVFDIGNGASSRTVLGNISADGTTVQCKPEFTPEEINTIEGISNVSVSILTPLSAIPIVTGYFRVYNCQTFDMCYTCTELSCTWSTYDVRCLYDVTEPSNTMHAYVSQQAFCPRVQNYTIYTKDGHRQPMINDTGYLSKDGNYQVIITGVNFPEETDSVGFTCNMIGGSTDVTIGLNKTSVQQNCVTCSINEDQFQLLKYRNGEATAIIELTWGGSDMAGGVLFLSIVVYECQWLPEVNENCGYCKSFATSQSHYHCQWCDTSCLYNQKGCNVTNTKCPNPEITKVYPLSVAVNATVNVTIDGRNLGSVFNDTVNAVTIAEAPCQSIEERYEPGRRIVCLLKRITVQGSGHVRITLNNSATGEFSEKFLIQVPTVEAIEPIVGPLDGGTILTLSGNHLNIGVNRNVSIGGIQCKVQRESVEPKTIVCVTGALRNDEDNITVNVSVNFDGALYTSDVTYTYATNPSVIHISPGESFVSGGRNLKVSGDNLHTIQRPRIYAKIGDVTTAYQDCKVIDRRTLHCPSPIYTQTDGHGKSKRQVNNGVNAKLGFIMDDVSSVMADNLPADIAEIIYYPNPVIYNLTKTKELKEIQDDNLVIKGSNLNIAATEEDVSVMIGCAVCNITEFTIETILCKPPHIMPQCESINQNKMAVQVNIGYYERTVGEIIYKRADLKTDSSETYIIASVMLFLVVCLVIAGVYVWKMRKRKESMEKEVVIKLDKLESNFRNQCREEFAHLQTAVSDLTTDLEGGNVLFREYSMFAEKTLFTSHHTETLKHRPKEYSEQIGKSMELFRGLLLNTQFLLTLIKTLEMQKSFSLNDKTKVATSLMVLNHDNMEYITGILLSLLSDLVVKNMAAVPKLMLRRSESVAEKLLTHWLSICMYHDLKSKTGSALYILYKAIKIQTEKGPIDYITNCAKYTLSEDKLFTFGDKDIKPITLNLHVNHFDYISNVETQVTVSVLDCDTITQAKTKMLEIFYKNVPYSQRPKVHSTSLAVLDEVDIVLLDEDDTSIRDGVWKRINTLQHYNITDDTAVRLYLDKEMEQSCKSLGDVSPDCYIVGTLQKSKSEVKAVCDYNFWHLTKEHQTDDEVNQASDLFLPRLATTKMTLEPYIEQLFTAVLSVQDEPSIVIKYLFDFLDMEASKHEVTDPDIIHTWKCNSLLLRFWVNIIKNPEFVFDIHKPVLVDSCLSVMAQTLMDSCSTADLILSKNSPSNKLLFAKDIPRYKTMVREYFQNMKEKPAVSDQDLNSYLTQNVSQKFAGRFNTQSAIIELFNYAKTYKGELFSELDSLETSSPGTYSPLSSKLNHVFTYMDQSTSHSAILG